MTGGGLTLATAGAAGTFAMTARDEFANLLLSSQGLDIAGALDEAREEDRDDA